MTEILLIRHGVTKGNAERRYIGSTDESLLPSEAERFGKMRRALLEKNACFAQLTRVFVSPLKRCRETAALLFPEAFPIAVPDLRECDFGEFEYRNYEELKDEPAYQTFIDTMGASGFPGGESREGFSKRCAEAFSSVCREAVRDRGETAGRKAEEPLVFVVHGGTIMAVMEAFAEPHRDYYDWQVKPGEGYAGSFVLREGRPVIEGAKSLFEKPPGAAEEGER